MIFNKISSIWDEAWWKSDSVGMTSFYKIDTTSTSYGSFNFIDYKDYYAITPGIGKFKLVVTTEGLNGSSYIGNYLFDTRILNLYGGLELISDSLGPDIYSDSITFTSNGYNTYYVEITNTIFSDFKYAATLNMVSNGGGGSITDTTAPTLSSITPADGATGVAVGANFVLTFNEAVKAGTGSFVVKSGTTTVSTIAVTDTSQVTFSGSTVTINPTSNLDYSKSYTVTVASGVIKDSAGNSWSGTGTNPHDFKTVAAPDTTAPTVSTFSPTDGATGVEVGSNIVLTFSEAIKKGTGTIYLRSDSASGAIVEQFDAASSTRITASGSTLTIDPTANLVNNKSYFVTFAAGSVKDLAGNNYIGTSTYDFKTVAGNTATTVAYIGNESSNKLAASNELPYSKNVFMYGYGGDDTLTGAFLHKNFIYGGVGNDQLNGGAYQNIIFGEDGNDTINAWQAKYSELFGGAGNDLITGGTEGNILDGGSGADQLTGGSGADIYVIDSVSDKIFENYSPFYENDPNPADLVRSSVSWTLGANLESLELTGTAAINGTGNALANTLTGNGAANTLDGGTGMDILIGGAGNDTYIVDLYKTIAATPTLTFQDAITEAASAGTDTLNLRLATNQGLGAQTFALTGALANLENLDASLTSTNLINLTGNSVDNTLTGNSGANILDGSSGADTLSGGDGNDVYMVDNSSDFVTESNVSLSQIDEVRSSVTWTLGANFENLTLTGAAAINGTGNALVNTITGNSAANTLNGGGGNDTLTGGAGNDTLDGGAGNDSLIGGDGTDTASYASATAAVSVSLALTTAQNTVGSGTDTLSTIENLTGSSFNDTLTGSSSANTINGGAGNDVINGGKGHDTLDGGAGNDSLIGGDGTDTASYASATAAVSVSLALTTAQNTVGSGFDTLTAIASLTGSGFNDTLTGNSAFNTLDGGAGNDSMLGGAGNDTYFVDSTSDRVYETTTTSSSNTTDAGGTDRIFSTVSLSLDAYNGVRFVEDLTLTGTSAINGTGNALANTLTGNSAVNTLSGNAGNDTLDGGVGADVMWGGAGNDVYYVDNASDQTNEAISASNAADATGTDLVYSSVTRTLGNYLENLTLTGTTAINGTGNALANTLTGNASANTLKGEAGSDILYGGLGSDSLYGGAGDKVKDVFDFNAIAESMTGTTRDKVYDFVTKIDKIDLSGIDANTATAKAGDQAFVFNNTSAKANSVWYAAKDVDGSTATKDIIFYGDVNGDAMADFEIGLVGVTSLTSADFVL